MEAIIAYTSFYFKGNFQQIILLKDLNKLVKNNWKLCLISLMISKIRTNLWYYNGNKIMSVGSVIY